MNTLENLQREGREAFTDMFPNVYGSMYLDFLDSFAEKAFRAGRKEVTDYIRKNCRRPSENHPYEIWPGVLEMLEYVPGNGVEKPTESV